MACAVRRDGRRDSVLSWVSFGQPSNVVVLCCVVAVLGGTSKAQVIPEQSHWGSGFQGMDALGVWKLVGLRAHI